LCPPGGGKAQKHFPHSPPVLEKGKRKKTTRRRAKIEINEHGERKGGGGKNQFPTNEEKKERHSSPYSWGGGATTIDWGKKIPKGAMSPNNPHHREKKERGETPPLHQKRKKQECR